MKPEIGDVRETVTAVTADLSADTLGNPGVNVLATPCLARLCDDAAAAVAGELVTRRMRIDIRHLAATPIGDEVRISAEIVSTDRDLMVCRIHGQDSRNVIVCGQVSRVVIDA